MERFQGGLVFKAHRLVYHPTLGWRVMKKKKKLTFDERVVLDRVDRADIPRAIHTI